MARACWEEMRGRFRERKVRSGCETERKFFEDREEQIEQVERKREQGKARNGRKWIGKEQVGTDGKE